jgi:hypothetical protein
MDTYILKPDGTKKAIKNLGWLLRNWKRVDRFTVYKCSQDSRWECGLTAHLRDGSSYHTDWACRSVCANWLARPVFIGLPVEWFGKKLTVAKGFAESAEK